jgi:hypothetical protein
MVGELTEGEMARGLLLLLLALRLVLVLLLCGVAAAAAMHVFQARSLQTCPRRYGCCCLALCGGEIGLVLVEVVKGGFWNRCRS